MTDREKLKKVRDNLLAQAEDINQFLDQEFNLVVYREGDKIKIESDIEFDELQWKVYDGEKIVNEVSVQQMVHETDLKPPKLPAKEYWIGNSNNINKKFEITVGTGYWDDKFIFDNKETIILSKKEENSTSKPKITLKGYGWWDRFPRQKEFPYSNTIHTDSDFTAQAIELGYKYVIPFVGGFEADMTDEEVKKRINNKAKAFREFSSDQIPFYIIDDEPTYDLERQEQIVQWFKEAVGTHLKGTFSYSGNHIFAGKPVAKNLEHVHANMYLYVEKGYSSQREFIETRKDFNKVFDKFMNLMKKVSPDGVPLTITEQTFGQRWTKDDRFEWKRLPPPSWSPVAYAEEASKHGIKFILKYLYDREDEDIVAKHIPGIMESVEIVYNKIKGN